MKKKQGQNLFTLAALFISILSAAKVQSGNELGSGSKNFPDVRLTSAARGGNAVQALGNHLPAVAAAYGLDANGLAQLFEREHTLAVDQKGRLFYADELVPEGEPLPGTTPTLDPVAASTIPLSDSFLLHSRPGAKRVIYLDFDGHVLSGTAWNGYNSGNQIVCPAWDIEGGPSVFTDAERRIIQEIWRRISEDFLPFDVDVTTQDPGAAALTRSNSTDEFYGNRVLISPISSYFGNYGGLCYVGCFDDVGDYYKTSLVFPEKLANAAKYVGEACAHESGHSVGLNHDGTTAGVEYYAGHGSGETGWAPIMGNSYYKNVTQWSKGEYVNANNTQQDLAVMQSYGLPLRVDDYGNTFATAAFLPTGSQLIVSGNIERNTDVDVIGFITGAGNISLTLTPAAYGPDLDIMAALYDSGGYLLAVGQAGQLLSCGISLGVSAGTYYLSIQGTGCGDLTTGYSSYASLGEYILTANLIDATGNVAPVAVANVSPGSGVAPLTVQFSSAQSFDLDGSIVSYSWNFGDGFESADSNPIYVFTALGDSSVILTVTDNDGNSDSTTIIVSVLPPNQPPTAALSASDTSGPAPLNVQFDGSTSHDSDGSIVSYQWNYGDGTFGSGATVQHTYASPGTYTPVLTVTDDRGAISQAQVVISILQNPNAVVRVADIALLLVPVGPNKTVQATVKVTNLAGLPVGQAKVTGNWSGVVAGAASGTTDGTGSVILKSNKFKKSGTVTFAVTGITANGYVYDASKNVATAVSLPTAAAP